ncbi:hypothetical protein NARC_10096 [Candidatus Nitrosocosmicus arcticus]|uniref:Uncharacterized protein n=2 Tax=Candidatus Nitrosocosmicus arcticus TaxID=2035267 RepID=A0A557SYK8_9ARCH|nr:hypothetical protein NARC_10096 [Candidatus Nitrosocosmicus arcticus]
MLGYNNATSKNWCKKYFKNHNDDDGGNGNRASQGIGQSQSSSQNSQCVSNGSTSASCNNISVQNQQNSGNSALAQGGIGKGGNKASQGIGQSQSSSQNSQVVSGGNTVRLVITLTSKIKSIQAITH